MSRKRLNEIDIASGIAILLVVFGHLSDYDPSWYGNLKETLYKFHMPFFMFISGFLLSYTSDNYKNRASIKEFILNKLIRFGVPYLFMSFLFLAVKIFLKEYNEMNSILEGLINILIEPTSGPSIFLWYIYVLFQFYIVFPLLSQVPFIKKNQFLLIIIGLVLFFIKPTTDLFVLNLFLKYFLFFSIGYVIVNYYSKFKILLNKIGLLFVLLFIGFVISDLLKKLDVPVLILGLLSIPSIMFFSISLKRNKILETIGQKTFVIYIWNSVFIFALSYLLKTLDVNFMTNFGIYIPVLVIAGIYGPLVLRTVSRKFSLSFLKKIIP